MSENLIGFGCDLQRKLDAMDPNHRKARWAGDVGFVLYGIARELHRLGNKARQTIADERKERRLIAMAQLEVNKLGKGIKIVRNPDPRCWPMVIVFPGYIAKGSGPEAVFEQGIAVPPKP